MKLLSILITFFLLASPSVKAGEINCLAQPTRACVLEMALDQAIAAPSPLRTACGFMAVAKVQKADGSDQYVETLRRMLVALNATDLNLEQVRLAFLDKRIRFEQHSSGNDPISYKIAISIDASPAKDDSSMLVPAALEAENALFETLIKQAPSDEVTKFAKVPQGELWFRGLSEMWGDAPQSQSDLRQVVVIRLVAKLAFSTAENLVASWPEKADRTAGYAKIAQGLARVGEFDDALRLAQGLSTTDLANASPYPLATMLVAETFARAGKGADSRWLLGEAHQAKRRYGDEDYYARRILFIGALVELDMGLALDLLAAEKDARDKSYLLQVGIEAYLTAGHTEIETFLAELPPEYLPDGLEALGIYQVDIGDAKAAMETLDRLQKLGTDARPHPDMLFSLVPLLAAKGEIASAVRLASDLKIETVTVRLASWIK